jgi:N-acetylgalactosamine kinase
MKIVKLEDEISSNDFYSSALYKKISTVYGEDIACVEQVRKRLFELVSSYKSFDKNPDVTVLRAPGRVNLIGEHTDYNGYPVMPIAINRDILACAGSRRDTSVRIANLDERFPVRTFDISERIVPFTLGDWGNYVKAAVAGLKPVIEHRVKSLRGFSAVFSGNIPPAGGLSSSSALVVVAALLFLKVNDVRLSYLELADLLARAEHFVGTRGGGMDQAISLMGQRNSALLIDFFPLKTRSVPLPGDHDIVICNSLIRAPKTEQAMNEYNRRPLECRLATALLTIAVRNVLGKDIDSTRLADVDQAVLDLDDATYNKLVDSALSPGTFSLEQLCRRLSLSPEQLSDIYFERSSGVFQPPVDGFKLKKRFEHVISEASRVRNAAEHLERGNIGEFGNLLDDSHRSCRDLYEISTEELDTLVRLAKKHGAAGARLTGAGFGGCTVNFVPHAMTESFKGNISRSYYQNYLSRLHPEIELDKVDMDDAVFASRAVQGAGAIID